MPRVQDGRLVGWQEHEALDRAALVVEEWLAPVHNLGEEQEPVTIMATTDEGPLPTQTVAAIHRDRLPTGRERARNDGLRRTVHDLCRTLVRQPRREAAPGYRELQIPPRGTVMARDFFHHPEHGERIYLQTPKCLGMRHAIQTRLEHGLDYRTRQAPLFFSLCSMLTNHWSNFLDPV
jgi:hypothetical protein